MCFIILAAPCWDSQNPDCNPDPALPLTSQQALPLQIIFIAPFSAWEYPECEVKDRKKEKKTTHSHLTCDQTSGTSSQRFWLPCPPAASYRTRTTNASPPAHPLPWQQTSTNHHHLNKPQNPGARVPKITRGNDPSRSCPDGRRVLCPPRVSLRGSGRTAWLVLTEESASQSRAQRVSPGDPPSRPHVSLASCPSPQRPTGS